MAIATSILKMTLAGKSTYIQRFTGQNGVIVKRPLHVLSNGNCAAVIFDEHDPDSSYGNQNSIPQVHIYESNADRTTWTKKVTYTLPSGTYGPTALHVGCVRNPVDDSIFIVWRNLVDPDPPGYALYGAMFSRSGSTWNAPGSHDLIYQPAERYPYRFDLDINPVTQKIVIGWMWHANDLTSNTTGTYFAVRNGPGDYTLRVGDVGLGSTGNVHTLSHSEDFTMAVDSMSDSTNTRVTYMVNGVMSTKDYGDHIGYRVFRNSDAAIIGSGWIATGVNAGRGGGRRTNYMFSTASGEFAVIGMGGTTSGEGYALKYKTTDPVSDTTPTYTASVPITYTSATYNMDRTSSIWNDVSVSYANDSFMILYHDGNFRDLVGKFSSGKATWEPSSYGWDMYGNVPVWISDSFRATRRAAVYGGARDASSVNKLDSLLMFWNRSNMSNPTAWAHQFNRAWRAPQSVVPGAGSTVSTSTPTLAIYADIDQVEPRSAMVVRWQIAKDSGFTTELKTHTSSTPTVVSGTYIDGSYKYIADTLPLALALSTGTWYVRAAQIDSFGTVGTYSTAQQFTVSHAPWGTDLTPSSQTILPYGIGNVTFSWVFQDAYANDAQSAYRILVTDTNDDSVVLDSGKITSAETFATLSIPSAFKNVMLAWQVQLWDMDDNPGSLSNPALFEVADPPVPTISFPLDGAEVDNARPPVTWTVTDPSGTGQVAFRVYFLNNGVQIHDSGWVNSAEQSYTPPDVILENLQSYSMIVAVRNGSGLEDQASVSFTTSWTTPSSPSINGIVIDDSNYTERDGGYVLLHWNYQNTDPEFLSWRLYRRYNLPSSVMEYDKGLEWEMIHEEFSVSPPDGSSVYKYHDYTAPSGYQVHYVVTQTALRFGSIVESTPPTLTTVGVSVSLYSGHYWLVSINALGKPEDAIRLEMASADNYTEEYETEEMHVIGRGRHFDIGDRLGYSGQLTIPLRFIEGSGNSDDPRRQKLDLEAIKAERKEYWIRTPFGDLFKASAGDMQFERVAGVGSTEFINVTLPYKEVYGSGS